MKQATFWRAAVLGGGVAVAVAPFAIDASRSDALPTPLAIEDAAAAVRARFADGDCVVVRPAWFSPVLSRLTGMGAGTESWPFAALMGSEDLDPLVMAGCRQLWWIDFFGGDAGPSPLTSDELIASERVIEASGSSPFGLTRYEPKPIQRLRSLSTSLSTAKVFRGPRGAEGKLCRYRGDRHRCETDHWLDVRLEARHVGHHEVLWPFVHPGPGDQDLRVVWGQDADDKREHRGEAWLVVRAGYSMEAVRHPEGTEVSVEIRVDGERVDTITLSLRRWELVHRVVPIAAGDAWPTVEFRIHADDPNWRELLLDADFTDGVPAAYAR